MAFTIDPANKRIVLDTTAVTAKSIYVAWADWVATSDNAKYLPAFIAVGGDDLGGGLSIPPYYFLANGWRVRPMEANQTLTITGNLFVDGGGDPVVNTIGAYNVLMKLVVPVQAQGIATTGSSITASEVAAATRTELTPELTRVTKIAKIHGVDVPLVVTATSRDAGDVHQTISTVGDTTTVSAA